MARMGRPPYCPTDEDRVRVAKLVAFGLTQDKIANLLEINKATLEKHFRKELTTALDQVNEQVANSLLNKAINGDTSSAIFWLKTRARWKDTSQVELTGEDGGPLEISINFVNAKDRY